MRFRHLNKRNTLAQMSPTGVETMNDCVNFNIHTIYIYIIILRDQSVIFVALWRLVVGPPDTRMADVTFSLIHCCSTISDAVLLLVDLYEMLTSLAFFWILGV